MRARSFEFGADKSVEENNQGLLARMSTVFDPDARTVKNAPVVIFLMVIFSGIMGPATFSGGWWIYACLALVVFIYMLYMRYTCERYTFFATSYSVLFIFSLAFAPACVAYIVVTDDLAGSRIVGALAALLLLSCTVLGYLYIYFTPAVKFPFNVSGNKVAFSAVDSSGRNVWIIAGMGTLASTLLIKSVTSLTTGILIILIFEFSCLAILIHSRHLIRGLRTLHLQERGMSTPYTFMQIEEIREARSRWWISRFFKWVGSRYKSPSA